MRRVLVAGNWKMNGTRADADELLSAVLKGVGSASRAEVAVCPPFTLIALTAQKLAGGVVAWGGQNLDEHDAGAFTGEISGAMLRDFGCTYVIVGHSERRALFHENDATVARKFVQAQKTGLVPILCVGELLEEREGGITESVIERQLDAVLGLAGIEGFREAVIAYEPVWAIGTGKTATPDQAQDVHRFIRAKLERLDKKVADEVRILYGGSVKPDNAKELLGQPDVDGGLIGGASLKAEDFLAICAAAD
jgi:triosephosphate isomerase